MSTFTKSNVAKLSIAILLSAFLSGCIIHVGDGSNKRSKGNNNVSSVFGSLEVSSGKQVTDVSSVNGSVKLNDDVVAANVESVNGNIDVKRNVSVRSLETVNGNISVGEGFNASQNIETINGSINISPASFVGKNVETINGDIEIIDAEVKGNISTHNGSILLTEQTHVHGDIKFSQKNRKTKRNRNSSIPTLKIKQGAIVDGDIILEREVQLDIDDAELLRKVIYRQDGDRA